MGIGTRRDSLGGRGCEFSVILPSIDRNGSSFSPCSSRSVVSF